MGLEGSLCCLWFEPVSSLHRPCYTRQYFRLCNRTTYRFDGDRMMPACNSRGPCVGAATLPKRTHLESNQGPRIFNPLLYRLSYESKKNARLSIPPRSMLFNRSPIGDHPPSWQRCRKELPGRSIASDLCHNPSQHRIRRTLFHTRW